MKREQTAEQRFDVIVIGGGGAALRAALAAKEAGDVTVAVLSKGQAGKSGATWYSVAEVGAFNVPDAALDPLDSPDAFFRDMQEASLGMADDRLSRILANKAVEALEDLERIGHGKIFHKINGKYDVYKACFSTRPRSHVIENHFRPILKALEAAVRNTDIHLFDQYTALEILTSSSGETAGVLVRDESGRTYVIRAKSVILANGGASRLFYRNMYPADITGDGYAMAFRAGAKLTNMEFLQAGIGVAHPFINLFGNYLWAAQPRIRNTNGEDVLEKYAGSADAVREVLAAKTHFPFSTRDSGKLVEIAVQSEANRGETLLLQFDKEMVQAAGEKDPIFAGMWEQTYSWHLKKGVDFYKDAVEITCFAHAVNGGVLIDENAMSSIPGLYAAGEVAAGPHGADRLGGNMSLTCQVFGKIAGRSAAERALKMKAFPDPLLTRTQLEYTSAQSDGARQADVILEELQKQSDRSLLIIREKAQLKKYMDRLSDIEEELTHVNAADPGYTSLKNLVTAGKLIGTAALERKESRGSHYREDYDQIDPEYEKNLILTMDRADGTIRTDWKRL